METTARFNRQNALRLAGVIKDLLSSEVRWQARGSRYARATAARYSATYPHPRRA